MSVIDRHIGVTISVHESNLRDRLSAVRHSLLDNSLPTRSLDEATGHLSQMIAAYDNLVLPAVQAAETATAQPDYPGLIRRYLLNRTCAPAGMPNHSAQMDALRESLEDLAKSIGFDRSAPYGRPEVGSVWESLENLPAVVTVQGLYKYDNVGEYVAVTIVGGSPHLIALSDWHLKVRPRA